MKKFWFGPKKKDEDRIRARTAQLEKLRRLIEVGGHEAESEYVEALKLWKPGIHDDALREMIRRFHDAVSERQSRDRGSRSTP
jgi:hypothetical protein